VELRLERSLDCGGLAGEHRIRVSPAEANRSLADALDFLAGRRPDLLLDDFAQQSSQKPAILAQRLLFRIPRLPHGRVHGRTIIGPIEVAGSAELPSSARRRSAQSGSTSPALVRRMR